jgi:hypothetical protein
MTMHKAIAQWNRGSTQIPTALATSTEPSTEAKIRLRLQPNRDQCGSQYMINIAAKIRNIYILTSVGRGMRIYFQPLIREPLPPFIMAALQRVQALPARHQPIPPLFGL